MPKAYNVTAAIFFMQRIVSHWNALDEKTVSAVSIDTFKPQEQTVQYMTVQDELLHGHAVFPTYNPHLGRDYLVPAAYIPDELHAHKGNYTSINPNFLNDGQQRWS